MDTNLGNGRESAADHLHEGSDPGLDTLNPIRVANADLSPTELTKQTGNLRVSGSVGFRGDEGLGLVDEGPE
jgi:hypothetical protein